jgi:hypothetical protein
MPGRMVPVVTLETVSIAEDIEPTNVTDVPALAVKQLLVEEPKFVNEIVVLDTV